MKKKMTFVVLIGIMMLQLVGCSNAIPDLSDQEMSMVTNYAADLLLKYNPNYSSKFLNDKELAEEEEMQRQIQEEAERLAKEEAEKAAKKAEKEAQEAAEAAGGGSVDQVVTTDPAEFLELDGFSISCNGISYVNSYPDAGEDMFFSMTASPSCNLAVVSLAVTNHSSAASELNIFDKQAKFKISINGGSYHGIASSYLDDDFSMYVGTFEPGQTKDLVLLIDLPQEECVDVSSIDMYIKYHDNSIKTNIY